MKIRPVCKARAASELSLAESKQKAVVQRSMSLSNYSKYSTPLVSICISDFEVCAPVFTVTGSTSANIFKWSQHRQEHWEECIVVCASQCLTVLCSQKLLSGVDSLWSHSLIWRWKIILSILTACSGNQNTANFIFRRFTHAKISLEIS